MAEPIEMLFGLWTRMGQGIMCKIGIQIRPREGLIFGKTGTIHSIGTFCRVGYHVRDVTAVVDVVMF